MASMGSNPPGFAEDKVKSLRNLRTLLKNISSWKATELVVYEFNGPDHDRDD